MVIIRRKMKDRINDWGLTYNIDYSSTGRKLRPHERESFTVRLCPSCNGVYENTHNQYMKTTNTHRYKGFPTIGLKRRKCPKCS